MMDILDDTIVKTRKEHLCDACHRRFPKGSIMRSQVNVGDGGIYNWRECETCTQLLSKHREVFTNPGDFNICYSNCVNEACEEGETPEMLLKKLDIQILAVC